MSVYVDIGTYWPKSVAWPYGWVAHLTADTLAELHEFALSIGLKRAWFQNHKFQPHYDLTRGKRHQAVRSGAIALPREQSVKRFQDARAAVIAERRPTAQEPQNA